MRTKRALELAWIVAWPCVACSGAQAPDTDHAFEAGLLNPPEVARFGQPSLPSTAEPTDEPAVARAQRLPPRPSPSPRPARVAARVAPRPQPMQPTESQAVRQPLPQAMPVPPRVAPQVQPRPAEPAEPLDPAMGLRASQRVDAALALLGTPGIPDRSFVGHVLRAAGQDVEVPSGVPYPAALHAALVEAGATVARPDVRPGDLVFFKNTADVNGNGRPDDGVTMVGVVERVEPGRVLFLAQRAGKVRRMAVDPNRPQVVRDAGDQVVNTRLVRWPGGAGPLTTGQCLQGYARPK